MFFVSDENIFDFLFCGEGSSDPGLLQDVFFSFKVLDFEIGKGQDFCSFFV